MSALTGAGSVPSRSCASFDLGLQPYVPVWRAMQRETERCIRWRAAQKAPGAARTGGESAACGGAVVLHGVSDGESSPTGDALAWCHQIWHVEHPPVLTLGRNAATDHVLDAGPVPVVRVDRGGQVTMHLPGQAVVYLLLDLARLGIGVRALVHRIETAMLCTLADWGIAATRRDGAPGVYVGSDKIGALGLRVTRGRCLHGLSLNVSPCLTTMRRMRPCGLDGTANTSMAELGAVVGLREVHAALARHLSWVLGLSIVPQATCPLALTAALARPPGR